MVKKNVIFESAQFNLCIQQPDEMALSFITVIHKLAEIYEYDAFCEDLIRDCLIVGILDASEKLQMMADLERTVHIVQQNHAQENKCKKLSQMIILLAYRVCCASIFCVTCIYFCRVYLIYKQIIYCYLI